MVRNRQGFTLIELVIVVVIIGVLAAIAYPSYQRYVIRTKRVDMMKDMQDIAQKIENQKLIQKSYRNIDKSVFEGDYPSSGSALYEVDITGIGSGGDGKWEIKATPKTNTIVGKDGTLKLHYDGKKCRGTQCGMGEQWKQE